MSNKFFDNEKLEKDSVIQKFRITAPNGTVRQSEIRRSEYLISKHT